MSNEYWKDYSKVIKDVVGEFEDNDEILLMYNLTDNVGCLFSYIRDGIISKVPLRDIVENIGSIYYDVACLELCYELPQSLYTNKIGIEVPESAAESVNLKFLHSELMTCLGDLSSAINNDDVPNIQYQLNQIITIAYDLCIYFNVNTLLPLKYNMSELKESTTSDTAEYSEVDFKRDYKERSKVIKELDVEEVLFEVLIDNRKKTPYKGISLKCFGEELEFNYGDIITDFFYAVLKLDKIKPNDEYSINYGEKLREYLNKNAEEIWFGFLVEEDIITVMEVQQKRSAVNGTVTMGKEAKPVIINKNIKDLNNLLDHTNKFYTI